MSISQKQAARKFVEYWTFQRGSEKGEDQQFWNSLLRDVLGIATVERHIKYQVPVQLKDTTKFLDAWIPETRVLIEHKSRGVNLDAPQSGHDGLSPYEQAIEYKADKAKDPERFAKATDLKALAKAGVKCPGGESYEIREWKNKFDGSIHPTLFCPVHTPIRATNHDNEKE